MNKELWAALSRLVLELRDAWPKQAIYQQLRTLLVDNDLAPAWMSQREKLTMPEECDLNVTRSDYDLARAELISFELQMPADRFFCILAGERNGGEYVLRDVRR